MSTIGDPKAYRYEIAPLPPEEGGGFVVSFPDIPGCLGVGDTEEEAIDDGQKACFAALDALRGVDRDPPVPSAPLA